METHFGLLPAEMQAVAAHAAPDKARFLTRAAYKKRHGHEPATQGRDTS